MPSYLFSLGNSSTGPVGFCARVTGDTPEAALATLKEHLDSIMGGRGGLEAHKFFDTNESIEYVTVYFNADAITVTDIEESETEDEDEMACEYCGAGDEPHDADCEAALAEDLADGTITADSDRYGDALEAYQTVYGKPFTPQGKEVMT